jgi:hypothetical protein
MKARVNPDISRRDLHSFFSNEAQAFIVSSLYGFGVNIGGGQAAPKE